MRCRRVTRARDGKGYLLGVAPSRPSSLGDPGTPNPWRLSTPHLRRGGVRVRPPQLGSDVHPPRVLQGYSNKLRPPVSQLESRVVSDPVGAGSSRLVTTPTTCPSSDGGLLRPAPGSHLCRREVLFQPQSRPSNPGPVVRTGTGRTRRPSPYRNHWRIPPPVQKRKTLSFSDQGSLVPPRRSEEGRVGRRSEVIPGRTVGSSLVSLPVSLTRPTRNRDGFDVLRDASREDGDRWNVSGSAPSSPL